MLKKSKNLKLDGLALYSASTCICQTIPIHDEDSGTDENENMHLVVKGFRRKVSISYALINGRELRETLQLMIKKVNYYSLTYRDPLLGNHTIQVYIPDYIMEVFNYAVTSTEDMGLYENLTLEFIGTQMTDY